MADVAIRKSGVSAVPNDYLIPGAQEIVLRSVSAIMDGTSAAVAWFPCLEVLDPSGNVLVSAVANASVAAGASADVSWFPGVTPATAASGSGIQFDTDNVGDWLEVETTGNITGNFSQNPAAASTGYATAFNTGTGGMLITGDATTPNTPFTIDNSLSAFQGDTTAEIFSAGKALFLEPVTTGLNDATGVHTTVTAENGTSMAVNAQCDTSSGGTGRAIAIYAIPDTSAGSGDAIALFAQTFPGSGKGYLIHCIDSSSRVVLRVISDGNVLMPRLPTSSAGLASGSLWNNGGVVNIV